MTMGAPAWILHVDLDQFLAAVELRRRPELRGRPVVVGGDGDPTRRRMVVQCASYEARAHGVRAGMALVAAARRCPTAVFLPSDGPTYEAASAEVMAALNALPVVVEVWGLDEAFLGTDVADPEALAGEVRRAVAGATGLACSVGIGETRQRAKIATQFAKPAGIYRLDAGSWMPVMGERPTDALWGIGSRTASSLASLGLHTVAQLADADPERLAERFGPTTGPRLREMALGGTVSELETAPRAPKSRGRQTTYPDDLTELAEIQAKLGVLAEEIAGEVLGGGYTVTHVGVTVRTASFWTRTRAMKLREPTRDAGEIRRAALVVLGRFAITRPVRLLGVRLDLAQ